MADLKCKHCGNRFVMGGFCFSGPNKKHIAISDGDHCVYCGNRFVNNGFCQFAPERKHQLDT